MEHGHPIRVVAKRTGMSPHLIRMWERRYGAVKPRRTETGRRLYTDEDIERLTLLRRATLEGQSIGRVARLSPEELRALIPGPSVEMSADPATGHVVGLEQHLNLCLQSMKNMDAIGLETRLLRASVALDQRTFLEKLLHPLMELTGEMWADGRLKVAHEHLASAVVRSLLGSMYLSNTTVGSDPLLLSASPAGQLHEFGALMASVTAASGGWRTLYLGPNLPAEDIADTAMSRNADAIALSIVYPADDPDLARELRRVRQLINNRINIIAGGRAAISYSGTLNEIGAVRVGSLSDLRSELARLKSQSRSPLSGTG